MEFDEFVRTRSQRLLGLAFLLTRDHLLAEDLVQHSLARAWPAWSRLDGDPEPYVRKIIVNSYASWRGRRWHGERPSAELPDRPGGTPQDNVDDRDEMMRALDRLPQRQRAVLMLRYFEDFTEAQIASALDISAGSVKNYAAKGLAKLRSDPTFNRVAEVSRRIEVRRRRVSAVATAAAAAAVLVLLLAVAAANPLHRKPEPAVTPTPSPKIEAMPVFTDGKRIQAVLPDTPFSTPETTFTWVPESEDRVWFGGSCSHRVAGIRVVLTFAIDGVNPGGSPGCSDAGTPLRGIGPFSSYSDAHPAKMGLRLGQPVTVTVRLSVVEGPGPLPVEGTYRAVIAQEVPFERYPLPSRPASLKPLERLKESMVLARVEASGSHEVTVVSPGKRMWISMRSQTPGLFRITVNGEPVSGSGYIGCWDYEGNETMHYFEPPWPELVVKVEPQHVTGDWYVDLRVAG